MGSCILKYIKTICSQHIDWFLPIYYQVRTWGNSPNRPCWENFWSVLYAFRNHPTDSHHLASNKFVSTCEKGWSKGTESTQYWAYKLYPFPPSFLIINLAGYLTNARMVGSSFFKFFLVKIAEFLQVARAGEKIWETKIEAISDHFHDAPVTEFGNNCWDFCKFRFSGSVGSFNFRCYIFQLELWRKLMEVLD